MDQQQQILSFSPGDTTGRGKGDGAMVSENWGKYGTVIHQGLN